jgi:hypothetical protein
MIHEQFFGKLRWNLPFFHSPHEILAGVRKPDQPVTSKRRAGRHP